MQEDYHKKMQKYLGIYARSSGGKESCLMHLNEKIKRLREACQVKGWRLDKQELVHRSYFDKTLPKLRRIAEKVYSPDFLLQIGLSNTVIPGYMSQMWNKACLALKSYQMTKDATCELISAPVYVQHVPKN